MQDQILGLQQLQSVDVELKEIEINLEEYPKKISSIKDEIKNAAESIKEKKNNLAELEKIKSEIEVKIQNNLDSIKKAEDKLFEIKTHKEYEALQKEIAETKRYNSELEEQVIEKMEDTEKLTSEIDEEEKNFKANEVSCKEKIDEYELLIKDLNSRLEPVITEKEKILKTISSDILPIYKQVINRNGKALALVENEVCTGCNMNIPPQLYIQVLAQNKIHQCPNCKKILYSNSNKQEQKD